MAGIGVALVFVSYTLTLYGYCLFRGYNINPKQLFSSKEWPPNTGTPTTPPTGASGGGGGPKVT